MKIKNAELNMVCGYTSSFPELVYPQFAIAGRSNSGKSSLVNTLVQRRKLAHIGATPGKTRTINFYKVEAEEAGTVPGSRETFTFYITDLPGYGYANVPEKEREKWRRMTERYLKVSSGLRALILLVDIRREPDLNDLRFYRWMQKSPCNSIVVASKADKVSRSEINKRVKIIRSVLKASDDVSIIPFSTHKYFGKEEIYNKMLEILRS